MVYNADKPAAPLAQASEAFIKPLGQQPGLTKREAAAIASLQGIRASGTDISAADAAQVAWEDAAALFADKPGGGA